MKPSTSLASCETPNGAKLELLSHDSHMYLYLNRQPICSTRACEPELALARLGCSRIKRYKNPKVLLAGLGLGQCLEMILSLAPQKADIVLSEPLKDIISWNKIHLGQNQKRALQDDRLTIMTQNLPGMLKQINIRFDAILISDDPDLQRATNTSLRACAAYMNPKGVLCVKTPREDVSRVKSIMHACNLPYHDITPVGARPNARTRSHAVIAAAARSDYLPANL